MKRKLIMICACIFGVVGGAWAFDKQAVIDAVSAGDMAVVTNYLSQGGDVNLRDDLPLGGYTLLMYAVKAQKPEICQLLLQKGARPDDRSRAGETALNLAELKYGVTLPEYHEKRIADAEKRLATASEKYKEVTRKRIEFYKKQYRETDTSEQAQQDARRIVDMLRRKLHEGLGCPTENTTPSGTNSPSAQPEAPPK